MAIINYRNAASDAAGQKAYRLAQLAAAGFRVPPFFVVTASSDSGDWFEAEIRSAIATLAPDGEPLAVRSSATEEDGAEHSFAGQFDSFLSVRQEEVSARIADVRRSRFSQRAAEYRSAAGLSEDGSIPAVIVQRMVDADAAGVAFAADPVSGSSDAVVIAATHGLGDKLVSGECQGDTVRLTAKGATIRADLADEKAPVLSARELRKVFRLVTEVSAHVGQPQDIEWALKGNRVYLLQSRDITTLPTQNAGCSLWDNSNIVESYGGVTTPLTFSVARGAYADAYRHMGRAIGLSERRIVLNAPIYEQMIGLIDGPCVLQPSELVPAPNANARVSLQ